MNVTFIVPAVGRKPGRAYVRTWQMEPLAIATLAALTPADVERRFFDDRLESIDYDAPTDLVAISVETYTAAPIRSQPGTERKAYRWSWADFIRRLHQRTP